MATKEELMARTLKAMDLIRPFLNEDGGDLVLKEITDDFIARVELTGQCTTCSMNNMTFQTGVKDAIMREVPEIKDVEAVNFNVHS